VMRPRLPLIKPRGLITRASASDQGWIREPPGFAITLLSLTLLARYRRSQLVVLLLPRLALSLLVPRILANHHHATVSANHLALVADPLDARLDLHRATF
jgi:hypothetical protein